MTKAEVVHKIEDGEFAHCNLRIEVDTGGDEEAIEPIKTLIVDRLWQQASGPAVHICTCDRDIKPHPSEWLTKGPQGPFVDTRSRITIVLQFIAYTLIHYPLLWIREKARALRLLQPRK
ncbi:hypothetical protein H8B02_12650 [Bradyrhizobium sp. Pear77]|uniref:hypothetical protein n=1 Tax=Bradyrhizobium altum TaxID=1571202 RepID=UPI001E31FC4F|nr:hypothetical protein [Bradyrhizobium altum]MCC8954274.1 hypothetical protein [Bradyrhizobium altum]